MSGGRIVVAALAVIFALGGAAAIADMSTDDDSPAASEVGLDDRDTAVKREDGDDGIEFVDEDGPDRGDGDDTRGNDGTNGGDNTGDGDDTRGNDGTNGGDNTDTGGPDTGGPDTGTNGGDNTDTGGTDTGDDTGGGDTT